MVVIDAAAQLESEPTTDEEMGRPRLLLTNFEQLQERLTVLGFLPCGSVEPSLRNYLNKLQPEFADLPAVDFRRLRQGVRHEGSLALKNVPRTKERPGNAAKPNSSQAGKRPKGQNRRLVLAAVCKLHGYSNGKVSDLTPATLRKIMNLIGKDGKTTIHKGQVSTAMKELFGGMTKYKTECHRDLIGPKLQVLQGEAHAVIRELRDDLYHQKFTISDSS